MSGFYLDVIKDRIYTLPVAGIPRRSAQSAMYHVLQTLVRCLAPVISFTAEEIWQHLRAPAEAESVFVLSWYRCLPEMQTKQADMLLQRWQQIRTVREQVAKKLEDLRSSGEIGSSLEAEVELCCPQPWYEILASLRDELRFVLIVSAVQTAANRRDWDDGSSTTQYAYQMLSLLASTLRCRSFTRASGIMQSLY